MLEHALAQFVSKHFPKTQVEAECMVSELVTADAVTPAKTVPKPTKVEQPQGVHTTTDIRRSA